MKKFTILIFVTTFFSTLMGSFIGFYLTLNYYGDLRPRLETIESKYKQSFNSDELAKMDELKVYVDKSILELNLKFQAGLWGIPITLISVLALMFSVYKIAISEAEDKIAEALQDEETKLKLSKSIIVITRQDGNIDFIEKFFTKMGFKKPTFLDHTQAERTQTLPSDLIFLNFEGQTWFLGNGTDEEKTQNKNSRSQLDSLLNKLPSKSQIFFFGPQMLPNPSDERFASANFKSQLYGNVINALKFQKML